MLRPDYKCKVYTCWFFIKEICSECEQSLVIERIYNAYHRQLAGWESDPRDFRTQNSVGNSIEPLESDVDEHEVLRNSACHCVPLYTGFRCAHLCPDVGSDTSDLLVPSDLDGEADGYLIW